MKKIVLILALLLCTPFYCEAKDVCGIDDSMKVPEYWICRAQHAKSLLMTSEEIKRFNDKIYADASLFCCDVLSLPSEAKRSEILKFINDKPFKERSYNGTKEADAEFWNKLIANNNTENINEKIALRFATAVSNDILKIMPYNDGIYDAPGISPFDNNVQTSVKIWDNMAILHESADGEYYLVRLPYAFGWIRKNAVALADRDTLKKYAAMDFYTVTSNRAETDIRTEEPNAGRRVFYMGTRLPAVKADSVDGVSTINSRAVLIPLRKADGTLSVTADRIPFSGGTLCRGYLPYTQANVIRQAFEMLGERYGWGGTFGARDCSGLVRDVYLTFGMNLPRNSRAQASVNAKIYDVEKSPVKDKMNILKKAPVGTLLYIPGHIMLYLGTAYGKGYVIQSVSRCILPQDKDKITTLHCVTVSDLDLKRINGKTCLESVTKIVTID